MDGTITLVTPERQSEINAHNYADSLQDLNNMLAPGTPVMFQRHNEHGSRKLLLLSGGGLSQDGTFDVQKGKRNYVYASINEDDSDVYKISRLNDGKLAHYRLEVPHSRRGEDESDHSFSPEDPGAVASFHEVVMGNKVIREFPDVINALQFAGDAVHFKLDQFYSRPLYLTFEKGDAEANWQREKRAHNDACLGAVLNLMREAVEIDIRKKDAAATSYAQVSTETYGPISATQLDLYKDQGEEFSGCGLPVDLKDYLLQVSTKKKLAFVKVGKGDGFGETYVLPAEDELNELVGFAFSDDFVKKFYPLAFRD